MSAPPIAIDPLVATCILDHYTRRDYTRTADGEIQHAGEVYGALLGGLVDGVLEIRCCFPVKHSFDDANRTIKYNMDFQKEMLELHSKIYTKDRIVGWYSNRHIPRISRALHSMYQGMAVKNLPAINFIIDPTLQNGTLNPKCFIMTSIKLAGEDVPELFKEVPYKWRCRSATEKIALDTLITKRHSSLKPIIEGLPDIDSLQIDDLQSCQRKYPVSHGHHHHGSGRPPFELVHKHLLQVQAVLKKCLDHVGSVIEGKERENPVVARELLSLIQSVPPVAPEAFDKLFNTTTQDMLMISYLSKLTQTQVQLMERLHVYVPDQKPGRDRNEETAE